MTSEDMDELRVRFSDICNAFATRYGQPPTIDDLLGIKLCEHGAADFEQCSACSETPTSTVLE